MMSTWKHNTNWFLDPSKPLVFLSGTKDIRVKFDNKIK